MYFTLEKLLFFRHWRVGQVNLHQADENHPRGGLPRWGEEDVHQAGLPEHIHGDAVHDQGYGPPQDPVWRFILSGTTLALYLQGLLSNVGFQEKGDLVRSIDYETVTSFEPPYVAAIKDLWMDPGIQVTAWSVKCFLFSFPYKNFLVWSLPLPSSNLWLIF